MIIDIRENKEDNISNYAALIAGLAPLVTEGLSKIGAGQQRNTESYQAMQTVKAEKYKVQQAAMEAKQAAMEAQQAKGKRNTTIAVVGIIVVAIVCVVWLFKTK